MRRPWLHTVSAHERNARTPLLQSQLDHIQVRDEMTEAMGVRETLPKFRRSVRFHRPVHKPH